MGDIPQLHWGHGHDFSDRDRFSGQRFCCFTQMDIPRPGWRKSVIGQHFRGRLRQTAVILVLAVAGVGAISGTSQAAPSHDNRHYTAGAPGSGDAYFPFAGNGGYDVLHYDLALRYTPPTNPAVLAGRLSGVRLSPSVRSRTWSRSTSTCAASASRRSRSTARQPSGPKCRTTRTGSGNSRSGCGRS